MLISGGYSDNVLICRLLPGNGSRVIVFSGERIPGRRLPDRYRLLVTPTILFLAVPGREPAGRRVGIITPKMYGGHLDTCIDTAL